jgi:hypothetical protein
MKIAPSNRHFYEVIPINQCCSLYFDLEFLKAYNPNANGTEMVAVFKDFVKDRIFKLFNIHMPMDCVYDLESTSDSKFSRHLIWKIPSCAFENNIHVGVFAHDTVTEIANIILVDPDSPLCCLFVNDSEYKRVPFVDLAVYTKNRNFRILGSSKIAKNIPLVDIRGVDLDFETFCNTLVIDEVTQATTILKLAKNSEQLAKSSRMPFNCNDNQYEMINTSPWPELDAYIIREISTLSTSVPKIRGVRFIEESWQIIYYISNNRFCHSVQREHKSNGVYYVLDLQENHYYQKCFDIDCRNFKSRPVAMPETLNPLTVDTFDSD